MIYKLLTHLPEIIDCFIGSEPKGENLKKLELGLEFLKILLGKDLVNVGDSRTIVLSNPEKVGKQVLQTIIVNNDYRKIFNIQKEDFNTPRDRKLYQSLTGEQLPSVPSSRREQFVTPGIYNHQMKNRSPQLNQEQITGVLRNLENLNQPEYRRHLFGINNSSLGTSAEERPFVYSAKAASSSMGNLISRASSSKESQYFLRKADEASVPLFRDKELGDESSESNRSYRIRGNSQSQWSEKDRSSVQRFSLQNPRKGMEQGMKNPLAVENTFGNLGQDLENVKSQLDSKKGHVSVKPDTYLGKLLNHLQTIAVGSEKESILPHHNYRYHPRDMEVLHEEMEREYSLINGIHKKPNLGRAVQNFVRRQVGYPVEYDQPTVKSINELIPLVDNGVSSFSIATPQLMEKIQQAKDFVSNETNHLRKKLLLNYLSRNILGKTAYLALGVLLMTTSVWPVGLALSSFSLAGILTDQGSNAYAFLVANLGQDRTDELLASYQKKEEGDFERVT
ncbi:hypothetical protein [Streptococcus danieliae]|uniref:hypothetical protein n=1 Tax=Streptococcus danieliae TaxID=747656 RepID=UPI0026F2217A|nr:hypothetical protein [Streptococcus danieliae]